MPIVLKYGPPGPILNAGYAAGVGRRQSRQKKDLLDVWQQQEQARQAALDRQQRAGLQQNAQDFQAGQNQFNLADRGQQRKFVAEQKRLDGNARAVDAQAVRFDRAGAAELGRDQQLLLQKNREEAIRDRDTMEGLRKGEMELPQAAQRKMDQLEAGLVDAMKLDPAQQQEFLDKYETEKRGLLRTARQKPQLSNEEEFGKNTFDKDGTLYQRNAKGGFDVLKEAPDLSKQNEKFQADTSKFSSTLHTEMVRMQKGDIGDDGKTKPLDSYAEEARKGLAAAGITAPQQVAQPAPNAAPPEQAEELPAALPVERGQWGDGQSGEPVYEPSADRNLTHEAIQERLKEATGLSPEMVKAITPELVQKMKAQGHWDPVQAAASTVTGHPAWTQKSIDENLKKYQKLPPDVAKGVTPELVQKMAEEGSADPVKAAIMYQSLTKDGSQTTADKSKQTMYPPEKRQANLANSQLPKPQSAEEYNALPSGSAYVYTDGTIRKKP